MSSNINIVNPMGPGTLLRGSKFYNGKHKFEFKSCIKNMYKFRNFSSDNPLQNPGNAHI